MNTEFIQVPADDFKTLVEQMGYAATSSQFQGKVAESFINAFRSLINSNPNSVSIPRPQIELMVQELRKYVDALPNPVPSKQENY